MNSSSIKWLATAIAVIAGIYLTGSAICLWAFIFPLVSESD